MKQSFKALCEVGVNQYKDRNFCTVAALAMTLDWSFGKAHRWMKKHTGRRNGCGLYEYQWGPAIAAAAVTEGKKFLRTDHHELWDGRTMTLKRFCKENPTGTFYVKVKGHAVAIIDGELHDWTADTAGRRKIISCYSLSNA